MGQLMTRGTHRYPPMDRVVYGVPLAEALAEEIRIRDSRAVYVMASGTLARQTDVIDSVRHVLGNRMAGVCAKIGAHTPRIDVVAAANEARAANADLVLTVGGGSVTDAAKMVGLCLGNDVTAPEQLDAFRAWITPEGKVERPPTKPPGVRFIAVPTTLSAGEFTSFAGCTDTTRHVKESFGTALMMPSAVILDPAVTIHTPEDNYVIMPNGTIATEQIVNYHAPTRVTARTVGVGLEYDLPPGEAVAVLKAAALETTGVAASPEPYVYLDEFADSSINYIVKFWISEPSLHKKIEHHVRDPQRAGQCVAQARLPAVPA